MHVKHTFRHIFVRFLQKPDYVVKEAFSQHSFMIFAANFDGKNLNLDTEVSVLLLHAGFDRSMLMLVSSAERRRRTDFSLSPSYMDKWLFDSMGHYE